jgi:DNA-binding MarR family transcriptional regulator
VNKTILSEIKQSKPFACLEGEAFVALQRTADQLNRRNAEMLKPFGLSPTQYNALRILRGAGESGLPCSEVGERMINQDPDITRLMDRLEGRGLVTRGRAEFDKRVVIARITAEGLQLVKRLDAPMQQFQRKLLGHMGERRLRLLLTLLQVAREQPA